MMNTLDIVVALGSTASRTEKEQIIFKAYMEGERDFFTCTLLCLNPLVSFGVKKVALIEEEDESEGKFSFDQFIDLAGKLQRRELTGHAARDAINSAALDCHVQTWNLFYRRVLLKDLNIGVERSTINKVLKKIGDSHPQALDYLIPVFGVQLAQDGADAKNTKKLCGTRFVDVKLDGMRLATILDKEAGTVTQWSRTGHLNENFKDISEGLLKLLPSLPSSIVLDGEVVSNSFQELMTQARRKTDADTSDAKLALFDIIPLNDFRAGKCAISQELRVQALCELQISGALAATCGDKVYVVPKALFDLDTVEGQESMRHFSNEAVIAGFEGIMVKDPKAGYEGKRNSNWLKIKPKMSVDLTVIGLEEGTEKYTGMLGALVCEGDEADKHIVVKVGGGLSDKQRAEFWENQSHVLGMIVEIEADAITQSRDSDSYSLRFPRFKRFRSATMTPGEKD